MPHNPEKYLFGIIGFRHVLVHGYDSLDHELVWFAVENKLLILKAEVEALLGRCSDSRR